MLVKCLLQTLTGFAEPSKAITSYTLSRPNQFCIFLVKVKVSQSCPTLCNPMDYTVYGILQARILEWVAVPSSRGASQPRDRTQVSCTAGRFLPAELQRKPNNTGIGSPSLLQQIFPTRESNRDLPHCGQILYHLSYEGSVLSIEPYINN